MAIWCLGLLPGPEEIDDDLTATRVVETAIGVGSEAALQFLARFRKHPGGDVQQLPRRLLAQVRA
ncbi:hypothetical protein STENM327S_08097 [Streptomyces tendae]